MYHFNHCVCISFVKLVVTIPKERFDSVGPLLVEGADMSIGFFHGQGDGDDVEYVLMNAVSTQCNT